MGVVLQILGLVITFTMAMEALRRFGIDVGWLNPLTFFTAAPGARKCRRRRCMRWTTRWTSSP